MMKNKKAFGDVASTLIMFIAVISVTTGVVILFKNYVIDTQESFSVQNDITSNKLKTSMVVSNIYYNTSSNDLYVYVKNVGQTTLNARFFDYFIDDVFIENVSVFQASNTSAAIQLVNPLDTFVVIENTPLSSGTHEVRLVTEYGVSVEDSFNV